MKIIAFYLPQFHEVKENNYWWGQGFTEWTNTKKSKPLYNKHHQPREPLNDFYYDLTKSEHREWQANLAKRYGIYGFCYYHYWFKGKRLLEKPFIDVLNSKEPDFPFCLSWANEPWTRTWDGGTNDVLINQEYGNKEDWLEHFNFLLEAFKDPRYIKVDDMPMFLIYKPEQISQCQEMLAYWQDLAHENGLKGIYFINTLSGSRLADIDGFNASVEFEPMYSIFHNIKLPVAIFRSIKFFLKKVATFFLLNRLAFFENINIDVFNYDDIWNTITTRKIDSGTKKTIPGAFVDWDNSARKGRDALIVQGSSPEKFERFLSIQAQRATEVYCSEHLFINAWNEWAEGAYLEPDKKYQLEYLEAVKRVLKK